MIKQNTGILPKKRRWKEPGLSAKNIAIEMNQREVALKPKSQDAKNREYIVAKLHEYIENGLSDMEAIELMLKDPIMDQFEYLEKVGINLRYWLANKIQDSKKIFNERKTDEGMSR